MLLYPISNCSLCTPNCTYNMLGNYDNCSSCNTSSCGYSDLRCLRRNSCYYYMLDNENCLSDSLIKIKYEDNGNNLIIILVCVIVPFFL